MLEVGSRDWELGLVPRLRVLFLLGVEIWVLNQVRGSKLRSDERLKESVEKINSFKKQFQKIQVNQT